MCGAPALKHAIRRCAVAPPVVRRGGGDDHDASAHRLRARPARGPTGDNRRLCPHVRAGRKSVVPEALSLARVHRPVLVYHQSRDAAHHRDRGLVVKIDEETGQPVSEGLQQVQKLLEIRQRATKHLDSLRAAKAGK